MVLYPPIKKSQEKKEKEDSILEKEAAEAEKNKK